MFITTKIAHVIIIIVLYVQWPYRQKSKPTMHTTVGGYRAKP